MSNNKKVDILKDCEKLEINNLSKYLICSSGEVWSKTLKKCMRKQQDNKGYQYITLVNDDGKDVNISVHKLVAKAFYGNRPNKHVVNHRDGNPSNNHKSNLEWVTYSKNTLHAIHSGLSSICKEVSQYTMEGKLITTFSSAANACKELGICSSGIIKVCKGKRNKAGGFRWKYSNVQIEK